MSDEIILAVVTFPEFGDALVTRADLAQLSDLAKKPLVIVDLSKCKMLDAAWFPPISALIKEAASFNHRVAIVGASAELRETTSFLKHEWSFFGTMAEALRGL